MSAVLACRGLAAGYGDLAVLRDVDLELDAGRVLVVLGPNGAGKTTLLTTMAGLLPRLAGEVVLDGAVLPAASRTPRTRAGLVLVPDDRSLFTTLSVAENLRAALPSRSTSVDDVVDLFPALRTRWKVDAGALSGGEQQMLALGPGAGPAAPRPADRRAEHGAGADHRRAAAARSSARWPTRWVPSSSSSSSTSTSRWRWPTTPW